MSSGDRPDPPDDTDPAVADTFHSEAQPSGGASPSGASASASAVRDGRAPRGIRTGDTLGRYEIGDELGEGGMATVFRARDKELRRDVAIKVLFPHLARRDELVRRFHREARAAAGLEHRNILRIYDVGGGEGDDPPFIVLELIRGRSLLEEIEQRGPMFPEVAACVGAVLADALAAAHAASIVHRDVKPANVLLSEGGRVLLADFGVARLETEDSLVTRTGALLGTPAYMSPEQAAGEIATARSDLYSLGATLYQLVTGALPYAGGSAKILAQIVSGSVVAPHKRKAAVGPDLSRVIMAMMEVEPQHRTASAVVAAAELRAIAAAGGLADAAEELTSYFGDVDGYLRDRTATIVTRVMTATRGALAEGSLPRAMALADRAAVLAPDDPDVATLIDEVAAGGRARGRLKRIAVAGLALAIAGGGVAVVGSGVLGGGGEVGRDDAAMVAIVEDASLAPVDAGPELPRLDAAVASLDAAPVPVVIDAAPRRPDARDPRPAQRDAGVAMVTDARVAIVDAPVAVAIDAAVVVAMGAILVRNDTYCDVTIDGEQRGRVFPASAKPMPVTAGTHRVTCSKPGLGDGWTQQVTVVGGKTSTVSGRLLATHEVAIGVDVKIDGVPYAAGSVAKLTGRVQVQRGGTTKFLTISGACQLRADLECYR